MGRKNSDPTNTRKNLRRSDSDNSSRTNLVS